jgi:hypothetical protein
MNKLVRNILVAAILATLFLVTFLPQRNLLPQHVDAWQVVTKAHSVLDSKEASLIEPFSSTILFYPPGSHLQLAIISSVSGLGILLLAKFIPAALFVILGLCLYSLSKLLLKSDLAALAILAFTPLALSNITMLGPYYIVPLAWGMVLSLLCFYFLVKESWLLFFLSFMALSLSHNSSMVFALIGIVLFFIFNKSYWAKVKYLFLLIVAAIAIFVIISGSFSSLASIVLSFFAFDKASPYLSFFSLMPALFVLILALGFYFILVDEKKASSFLIPFFLFLVINAFLYWNWKGFFLVYRRLFTFLFLMSTFFVGYGVFRISHGIERVIGRSFPGFKKNNIALIIILALLVPFAVKANLDSHRSDITLVTNDEGVLFASFGQLFPTAYVATDHLQSFALPYYNLRPVQLSPAHGTDILYYEELHPCYESHNATCFESFFSKNNFTYLHTRSSLNSSYFKPFFSFKSSTIYWFDKTAKVK